MEPALSVVIVNWNTRGLLRQCLRSLEWALGRDKAQLLMVDNASSDGSTQMVESEFPWVEVIASQQNLGFAAGNNLALERARGRYVLLLNPDTEVTPGAIEQMTRLLDGRPDVGIVGTTLLNPDGSLQLSCHRFYGFRHSLKHNRLVDRLVGRREMLSAHRAPAPVDVDWMTGACLTARKSALDEVGVFDPSFFVYGEEIDLQYRMHRQGWRVVYVPSPGVVHYGGQSARQSPGAASLHDYRGRWLFLRKHYPLHSRGAYLAKTVVALAFWATYWRLAALAGRGAQAGLQWRAHWQLLTWHLADRGMPPVPTRPALPRLMGSVPTGPVRLGLCRPSVPMEEVKP